MGILTVYLDRATKLKDKDTIGKSDPYIKFELEQNNTFKDKNYGDQKSTTKKNDLDPVYEETVSSFVYVAWYTCMYQVYCLFESLTVTLTHCIRLSTRIFQL